MLKFLLFIYLIQQKVPSTLPPFIVRLLPSVDSIGCAHFTDSLVLPIPTSLTQLKCLQPSSSLLSFQPPLVPLDQCWGFLSHFPCPRSSLFQVLFPWLQGGLLTYRYNQITSFSSKPGRGSTLPTGHKFKLHRRTYEATNNLAPSSSVFSATDLFSVPPVVPKQCAFHTSESLLLWDPIGATFLYTPSDLPLNLQRPAKNRHQALPGFSFLHSQHVSITLPW